MSHPLFVTPLAVALALAWRTAAAEPATAALKPASTPATAPSGLGKAAPAPGKSAPWYNTLKGIPLGPGTLDINVNIRTRYEFTDNFNVRSYGTEQQDHLLLLRSRLGLDYNMGKSAHVYAEMQDARYGSEELPRSAFQGGSNPFYDEVELRQAFLEWQRIADSPLGFKAGRQTITYGDRRIFGPGEWGNVGRYWWDAARLYWHTKPVKVDLLYGRQIVSEPTSFNDTHFPFTMSGLYAQFRPLTNGSLTIKPDAFYVGRYDTHGNLKGESGTGDEIRHTLGLRADGLFGRGWDYYGTFAGQFGEYGKDDIAAFGAVAGLGYTWSTHWKPRLGAEFAYASGDDDPTDGTRGTFDSVYGAADAYYYGWMNVVNWMNLENYQVSFAVHPAKDLKVWVEYNYFRLASSRDAWYYGNGRPVRRDPTGQAGRDLGHEINLLGQWKLHPTLGLLAGYGLFLPGEFVRETPGSDDPAHWVFAQLTFNM